MNFYSKSLLTRFILGVSIFIGFLFMSCSKEEAPDPSLAVEKSTIEAPAAGTTETIAVKSNSEWKVTPSEAWVTVNPASGKGDATVTVTIAANGTLGTRTATLAVRLVSDELNQEITVTQVGATPEIAVEPTLIEAPTSGGTYTVTLTGNVVWRSGGNAHSWITYTPVGGSGETKVSLIVSENQGGAREGKITFYQEDNPDVKASVTVKQAALGPFLHKAGNYVQDAVSGMPGDIGGYTDFGVLAYKITATEASVLTVTDKMSEKNIWWVLYDDVDKIGSWEYPKESDGTLVYDVEPGTYYLFGLLNYWYDDITGKESTIQYELEITCKGATAEAYRF